MSHELKKIVMDLAESNVAESKANLELTERLADLNEKVISVLESIKVINDAIQDFDERMGHIEKGF